MDQRIVKLQIFNKNHVWVYTEGWTEKGVGGAVLHNWDEVVFFFFNILVIIWYGGEMMFSPSRSRIPFFSFWFNSCATFIIRIYKKKKTKKQWENSEPLNIKIWDENGRIQREMRVSYSSVNNMIQIRILYTFEAVNRREWGSSAFKISSRVFQLIRYTEVKFTVGMFNNFQHIIISLSLNTQPASPQK